MNEKEEKNPKPSKGMSIPRQGEIWLAELPKIKEFSKPFRPVLVISNDLQNEFDNLTTIATLTTDDIENAKPFEVYIENTSETGLDYPSKILVGYSFTIYKELRLIKRLGVVSEEVMIQVKTALRITFDLED
jgi:mRNA-degrading endonuclease toxin of MazEF toxin-antitoxin module